MTFVEERWVPNPKLSVFKARETQSIGAAVLHVHFAIDVDDDDYNKELVAASGSVMKIRTCKLDNIYELAIKDYFSVLHMALRAVIPDPSSNSVNNIV